MSHKRPLRSTSVAPRTATLDGRRAHATFSRTRLHTRRRAEDAPTTDRAADQVTNAPSSVASAPSGTRPPLVDDSESPSVAPTTLDGRQAHACTATQEAARSRRADRRALSITSPPSDARPPLVEECRADAGSKHLSSAERRATEVEADGWPSRQAVCHVMQPENRDRDARPRAEPVLPRPVRVDSRLGQMCARGTEISHQSDTRHSHIAARPLAHWSARTGGARSKLYSGVMPAWHRRQPSDRCAWVCARSCCG